MSITSPADHVSDGNDVTYDHLVEAIYRYQTPSAESGQPNPYAFAYERMSRAGTITNRVIDDFRNKTTPTTPERLELAGTREFYGVRVTITREETPVEDDE